MQSHYIIRLIGANVFNSLLTSANCICDRVRAEVLREFNGHGTCLEFYNLSLNARNLEILNS